ncbi:MAG: tRNA-dihydrouridine synthase family protein, partial [bacterium]
MINSGFWGKLKKPALPGTSRGRPIMCLAPMADVTDCAFRQIIAKYSLHGEAGGGPDVFWTEFVSADGLAHPIAREKLLIDFIYGENERPIVAQIFGSKPENIKTAAALCKELGFDGIDINMGCPDKSIEKQCSGAAMIKNPALAREVIRAAIVGGGGLPVSVKTRIGYNKNEIETWIPELLKEDIAALTVHLRTRKEMSDVPAHWDLMKRVVEIRDELKRDTLILGNGDATDIEDAKKKVAETGCDGVMLGRAIFGNPWLFADSPHPPPSPGEEKGLSTLAFQERVRVRLSVMVEHTKLFEEKLGKHKNFAIMKKHY